jgi:hypothetical protein
VYVPSLSFTDAAGNQNVDGGDTAPSNTNIVNMTVNTVPPSTPPTQTLTFTSMTKDTGQMSVVAGTAQSPANGTKVIPMAVTSGAWGTVTNSLSTTGSASDPAATLTSPWVVVAGTPSFIRDDNNGGIGEKTVHVRLDQGDIIGATFQAYQGVQYRANDGIFRKVDGSIAGATTLTMSVRSPSGVVTVVKSANSTRVGGSSGWDGLGSDAVFTASETGVWTVRWEATSTVPLRMLANEVIVNNSAGEVVSSTVNVINNSDWTTSDSSAGRVLSGTISAPLGAGDTIKVYRVVAGVETLLGDADVASNGTTWAFTDTSSYNSNWSYKVVVVNAANVAGAAYTQAVTLTNAGTTSVGGETGGADTINYASTASINTLAGDDLIDASNNSTLAANLASQAVLINGGAGVDTLRLRSGTTLNLMNLTSKQTVTRIQEVEIFQLQGNSTLTLSANSVLSLGQTNLTGTEPGKVQFVVRGTATDTFILDGLLSDGNGGNTALMGTWTKQPSTVSYASATFDVYNHSTSEAQVLVQTGVSVTLSSSPLVLDLNGDGVQTLAVGSGVAFDLADLGLLQKSAWIDRHDGLLAMDLNRDGRINSGAELFGNSTLLANGSKAADGWAALAALDSNSDGKVDALDERFADLRVWVDANGDGLTDAGELNTLMNAGIASLDLAYAPGRVEQNGNILDGAGRFTKTNGDTGEMTDAWLQVQQAVSLDLSNLTSIADAHGHQTLDLADGVAQSLALNLADVMAVPARSDGVQAIKVDGDAFDVVTIGHVLGDGTQAPGQWIAAGITLVDGHTYNTYHSSTADNLQLLIDSQISQVTQP